MKKSKQRSVYVDHEDWEKAKEMAWQRRMSVSALFVRMLDQESEKPPPKVKRERGSTSPGQEAG
jgi:hypothetical protein